MFRQSLLGLGIIVFLAFAIDLLAQNSNEQQAAEDSRTSQQGENAQQQEQEHRYYLVVFAAEGSPNTPHAAHSFATFIRVEGPSQNGGDSDDEDIEMHTISWLPASLDVHLLNPPEKGANLNLEATLKLERSHNCQVFAWGPFEIRKSLYDRALAQMERLQSGKVAYKALDRRFRPDAATNCFHAISDIAPGPLLDTGTAYGVPASEMVLQHLSRWIVEPGEPHRDLRKKLAVDRFPINYRD